MNDVRVVIINKSTKRCQKRTEFKLKVSELKKDLVTSGAKKILAEFSRKKTFLLLPFINCCDLWHFARASVPLPDTGFNLQTLYNNQTR